MTSTLVSVPEMEKHARRSRSPIPYVYQSSWMVLNVPVTLTLTEAAEQDLHLGIIGSSRLAVRAVKFVLVCVCLYVCACVCEREKAKESSSLSRLLPATQILARECPCSLIKAWIPA